MATIPEALAIALEHHKAGRLQAAEQIYRQILAREPKHVNALHLLGVAAHQQGQHEAAVDLIRQAIGLRSTVPDLHNNLGEAYRALRQWEQAIECYQRAVQLKPDYAEAHNNLGIVWQERGDADRAIQSLRRAVRLKPNYAEAYYNLGNARKEQGEPDQAVQCYQRAVQLRPGYAEAHNNLGLVRQELGAWSQAVECYQRALELRPDFAETHNNLGNAWQAQGQLKQSVPCYQRALQLKPTYVEAHNNLGNAWKELGKLDAAIECYQRAVQLKPDYAEAYNNLGNAWKDLGKLDQAIECYRLALQYRPEYAAARGALAHQLQHVCQWEGLETLAEQVIESVAGGVKCRDPVAPFGFLTLTLPTTAEQQLRCTGRWGEQHLKTAGNRSLSAPARCKETLVIGYLSSDFHSHATACLITELIEKHDRRRFRVHGYSYGIDDGSALRRRVVQAFDRFVEVRAFSFVEAAERIAQDGVDILVDLKGYTAQSRPQILALRPAPIQVNYLGYPGTMGASFMDYILVDHFVVPGDQQPCFSERLVHLPGCYQVNDSRREIASRTPSRAECGLPEEGFVFCSFNNSYKITPAVFEVWMRLLQSVPGSVLWLLEGNAWVAANLRREAAQRGVAAERVVFGPKLPLAEHLARHRLAGLFLDTYPVTAHTTTSDALWAGCPLLTMAGQTFVSRVAGSLLQTIGLPELVTSTLAEYEEVALRLAREPEQLAELRTRLEANRLTCGLFDGSRFARHVEQAYERMWEIYTSGGKPRAFEVAPLPCSP